MIRSKKINKYHFITAKLRQIESIYMRVMFLRLFPKKKYWKCFTQAFLTSELGMLPFFGLISCYEKNHLRRGEELLSFPSFGKFPVFNYFLNFKMRGEELLSFPSFGKFSVFNYFLNFKMHMKRTLDYLQLVHKAPRQKWSSYWLVYIFMYPSCTILSYINVTL